MQFLIKLSVLEVAFLSKKGLTWSTARMKEGVKWSLSRLKVGRVRDDPEGCSSFWTRGEKSAWRATVDWQLDFLRRNMLSEHSRPSSASLLLH